MAIKSNAEYLEDTLKAIDAVLLGQSYSLSSVAGSRSVTLADLPSLEAREKRYRKLVAIESRGGGRVRGVIPIG